MSRLSPLPCESLTTISVAPASRAPAIAASASAVMKVRLVSVTRTASYDVDRRRSRRHRWNAWEDDHYGDDDGSARRRWSRANWRRRRTRWVMGGKPQVRLRQT